MNKKEDMAQIPYIEHECRMYKAYCRERRWFWTWIATVGLWIGSVVWLIVR